MIGDWISGPGSYCLFTLQKLHLYGGDDGDSEFDIDYLAENKIECFSSGTKKFGWNFKIIGEDEVEVNITDEPEISPFTLLRKK